MSEARDLTEFNLLYGQAGELAKAFPESQFKTLTALFVVIGWLLTAATAQSFIKAHAAVALPGTVVAFALLAVFKAIWIRGYYLRAKALHSRLSLIAKAQGLSPESVAVFDVGPLVPITLLIVNLVACIAVVVVVWLVCA